MKPSGGFIFLAIGSLVVGGFLLWFWHNFDRVAIEHVGGATREARTNHLLGAEHLLTALDKNPRSLARLTELPPAGGTLFLPTPRRKLSNELIRDIKTWASGGGHLVVVASGEEERDKDRILDDLAVSGRNYSGEEVIATVRIDGWEKPLKTGFSYTFELGHAHEGADNRIESDHGVHAVSIPVDAGWVTILSDYAFATNDQLAEYDNAAYLWSVLSRNASPDVWLVYGVNSPSLWDHLLESAWMALVSVAVLVIALIGVNCRRFGPLIPRQSSQRRRLLEHIEAGGRFLWRYRQSEELLHAVQASLLRSLEFRHPGWSAADDLHRKLAQASGFTQQDVMLALTQREVREEHTFTQLVRTLELIRNRL